MVASSDSNSEWLHTVAHDLKTPINSVRGCIELVKQLGPLNERQEHFATRAMAGLQRMEHLVSRLLDISWVDAGVELDLEPVSLRSAIDEAVNLLEEMASAHDITVVIKVDSRLERERILVDERRLAQVLDNLISNAIKYNRDSGSVTVIATVDGDQVRVIVKDTGIGISEEDQPRIFERFFRSRHGVALKIEGSGLGLAITKAIIERHSGRIWFESVFDKGTTFYFTIPLNIEIGEGDDSSDESIQDMSIGRDGRADYIVDAALEESDSIDDSLQENRRLSHLDESSDEH
jgi:two-component system, cell cycle sensor histidine kinase PleC